MNVVILLTYRKSIFNFAKKLLELASVNLELVLETIFLIPRRMLLLEKKKKLGRTVIVFCIQVYWKEKKHTAGRNLNVI